MVTLTFHDAHSLRRARNQNLTLSCGVPAAVLPRAAHLLRRVRGVPLDYGGCAATSAHAIHSLSGVRILRSSLSHGAHANLTPHTAQPLGRERDLAQARSHGAHGALAPLPRTLPGGGVALPQPRAMTRTHPRAPMLRSAWRVRNLTRTRRSGAYAMPLSVCLSACLPACLHAPPSQARAQAQPRPTPWRVSNRNLPEHSPARGPARWWM